MRGRGAVGDRLGIYLGEGAHRRPAALRAKRRKGQRVQPLVAGRRRAKELRRREGSLAATPVPDNLKHPSHAFFTSRAIARNSTPSSPGTVSTCVPSVYPREAATG